MEQYLKIIYICFVRSLLRDLSFKTNLVIRFFTDSFYFVIYFIYFSVLFTKVPDINGWSEYEVLLLMGTFHTIFSFFLAFFLPNLSAIPGLVREGRLDGLLLKPVDTQFLLSINNVDIGSISNIFLGLALVTYSIHALELKITVIKILYYIFFILVGASIHYCIFFIFLMTAFWMQNATWCIGFFLSLNNFMDKPLVIYRGLLGRILTYLIPIALVANIPANILLEKDIGQISSTAFFILLVLYCAGRYLWKAGLNYYEGASI